MRLSLIFFCEFFSVESVLQERKGKEGRSGVEGGYTSREKYFKRNSKEASHLINRKRRQQKGIITRQIEKRITRREKREGPEGPSSLSNEREDDFP